MTDQQKRVLEHLAVNVMGNEIQDGMMRFRPPPTAEELEDARFSTVQFLQIGTEWNPFESAEDALEMLEKVVKSKDFVRLDYSGGTECWNCYLDLDDLVEVELPKIQEAITLACYRATGGTEL